jgi:hypothetical protein
MLTVTFAVEPAPTVTLGELNVAASLTPSR